MLGKIDVLLVFPFTEFWWLLFLKSQDLMSYKMTSEKQEEYFLIQKYVNI